MLKFGGRWRIFPGMDLINYRQDQFEKRCDAADARMARVEEKLTAIQVALADTATKDFVRRWGLTLIAVVLANSVGLAALLLQASNNQLAAFQAGLAALQTVAAAPPHTAPARP